MGVWVSSPAEACVKAGHAGFKKRGAGVSPARAEGDDGGAHGRFGCGLQRGEAGWMRVGEMGVVVVRVVAREPEGR